MTNQLQICAFAAAAFARPALRGRSELEMTSAGDRAAAGAVAHRLA
jgi:hypothetical protein